MRSNVRYLAIAAMIALAGCGEDGVSPGDLTEAEAQELAAAIFAQSFASALQLDYQPPAQAPGGPALITYSESVEATGPCPLGGQVTLAGTVDGDVNDETGAGTFEFSVDLVHAACGVQGDEGTQFTLTGNPGLGFDFFLESDGEQNLSYTGDILGAIDWSTSDKEGSVCEIDYDFSGDFSAGSISVSAEGRVCGVDFSHSVTVQG